MARKARLRSKNRIYHVMLRGNDQQDIFIDDEDKNKLMRILADKKRDGAFFIFAFCILPNHLHLLIREGNDDITRILKRTATSYAHYFNKKHNKAGHVFQDRFKSEIVADDDHLLKVMRFIHQNAAKAGFVRMSEYPWSSYSGYTGAGQGVLDCGEILEKFSKDRNAAIKAFISYNGQPSAEAFLDIADEKEIDSENAEKFVKDFLKERAVSIIDLKKPESKKVRDSVILYLLNGSNLSRRNIAGILGINRETVRKVSLTRSSSA